MSMSTNADPEREEIVFGRQIDWGEETRGQFIRISPHSEADTDGLDAETAQELIDKGYLDPEQRQNNSPRMQDLVEYAGRVEDEYDVDVMLTGYMVGPERRDTRITLTGIEIRPTSGIIRRELERSFAERYARADDLSLNDDLLSAWWD